MYFKKKERKDSNTPSVTIDVGRRHSLPFSFSTFLDYPINADMCSFHNEILEFKVMTKPIGFRSVGLYTGNVAAPKLPAKVDPKYMSAFLGCFNDGNIYWGGPQHALPFLAGSDNSMTVPRCLKLCDKAEGMAHNPLISNQVKMAMMDIFNSSSVTKLVINTLLVNFDFIATVTSFILTCAILMISQEVTRLLGYRKEIVTVELRLEALARVVYPAQERPLIHPSV